MFHTIGRKNHSEGIVDLLLACHTRIRGFIAIAIAIGERTDASDEDVIDASARVQRYFSEALPLHVEDEEEGVFPRLHGRSAALDAALDRMLEEHDRHAAPLRRLRDLCALLRTSPRDAQARTALAVVARELSTELEPHLQAEQRVVFPAIEALLTIDEQQAIARDYGRVVSRPSPAAFHFSFTE